MLRTLRFNGQPREIWRRNQSTGRRPLKMHFKYGYFRGMSPLCAIRLRNYPELQVLPIDQLSDEDKPDAQHQWATGTSANPMERCFEEDCHAVRPKPMANYSSEDQNHILQTYFKWLHGEVGEPLPAGQIVRH